MRCGLRRGRLPSPGQCLLVSTFSLASVPLGAHSRVCSQAVSAIPGVQQARPLVGSRPTRARSSSLWSSLGVPRGVQPFAAAPAATAPSWGPPDPHGASARQGRPPSLPTPGAHISVLATGLQRPEPLRFPLGSGGRRLRSRAGPRLNSSPGLQPWGQAAGSGVCRLGSDPCNRAQTGLCGSRAGPIGSPTQHKHRLPLGRLVVFG
ncbi:hypothetical protein NDU88_002405 [Pleurodeles waltl]|uniref:Secreted protein n=1 Tax=Pleurodeles waltl TaxID=8319 RepID=A0AAV7TN08_PLEWA|nr:hypothetical protein NDU88_002405 [Pleurodeles waltl]